MDELVQGILSCDKIFIGGNLNGHVGTNNTGFYRVHNRFGHGTRNSEGEVLDFCLCL